MRRLRTTSTRRLYGLVAVVALLAATAGIAQAALGGSASKPDPKPLDRAVLDAVTRSPRRRRQRARDVHQRAAARRLAAQGGGSPLAAGRQGPPVAGRRRPLPARAAVRRPATRRSSPTASTSRVYDPASKTAYTCRACRRRRPRPADEQPTLADVDAASTGSARSVDALRRRSRHRPAGARATPSGSRPRTTAGCSAPPSWRGTPSRASRCAPPSTPRARTSRCSSSRRRRLATARSPARRFGASRPPGTQVVEIDPHRRRPRPRRPACAASRPCSSGSASRSPRRPSSPACRARASGSCDVGERAGALSTTARAWARSSSSSTRRRPAGRAARGGLGLPEINIDGATGTELATPLGTVVTFKRDGVRLHRARLGPAGGRRERGAGAAMSARPDRGPRPGQALRRDHRGRRRRPHGAAPATSTATSGRTAPARRRRCGCCSG